MQDGAAVRPAEQGTARGSSRQNHHAACASRSQLGKVPVTRLPKFAAGGSRNAREDWPNNVGSCAKGAGGLHRHEVDHICYWGASEKTTQVNHSGRSRLGLGDDFPCGRGRRDGPHAIISSALAVQILPLTGCPLAMRGPAHYRVAAGGRNVSGISANTNAITAMAAMLARISSGFTLSAVSAGE